MYTHCDACDGHITVEPATWIDHSGRLRVFCCTDCRYVHKVTRLREDLAQGTLLPRNLLQGTAT